MFNFKVCVFLAGSFVFSTMLAGCNKDEDNAKKQAEQQNSNTPSVVIVQQPSLSDIIQSSKKAKIVKRNVNIVLNEYSVSIEDNSEEDVGKVLLNFQEMTADHNYKIKINIKKSSVLGQYSQIKIKFLVGKSVVSRYFYVVRPQNGRVTPQKMAKKDMIKVTDKGNEWIFEIQAQSPSSESVMQISLIPAAGKKHPTGSLVISSIHVK